MELEFDVKMTPIAMYDYLLRHTYSTFSGMLGTIVGVIFLMVFFHTEYVIYLIAGVVLILYIPVTLFLRANQQVQNTPAFKKPLHYVCNDEGVSVSQDGTVEMLPWDACVKAVSTSRSIILYTSKTTASIFPKKDLGEKQTALIAMISTHMEPKKVKIRS